MLPRRKLRDLSYESNKYNNNIFILIRLIKKNFFSIKILRTNRVYKKYTNNVKSAHCQFLTLIIVEWYKTSDFIY